MDGREVDMDGGGDLDLTMFVKLVRKCKEREHARAVSIFQDVAEKEGLLDKEQLQEAFSLLGCFETCGHCPRASRCAQRRSDFR